MNYNGTQVGGLGQHNEVFRGGWSNKQILFVSKAKVFSVSLCFMAGKFEHFIWTMLDCSGQYCPTWPVHIIGWVISWSETCCFTVNHSVTVTKRCHRSEIFLRMAACSTWAPECCSQRCSTASIVWPFAVRVLPHHATVARGGIAHPRPARDAWTTTFAFSPVNSRSSRLTWKTWMTVALGSTWTCCDYY